MRAAVSFLTVVGRGSTTPDDRTLDWFPPVGAAIGLFLGALWWLTARAWPLPVAAAIFVIADLAVTGMLHFDGVVDSADGLLPHLSVPRRLEVMTSPGVGAFGVAAGAAVLLVRWAAVASMKPSFLLPTGLWCLSRTAMAIVVTTQPYARREGGIATAFSNPVGLRWIPLAPGAVLALTLILVWRPVPGVATAGAAAIVAGGVVVLARRRVGGYTGDVLGACGFLAETVGLVVAAAKW